MQECMIYDDTLDHFHPHFVMSLCWLAFEKSRIILLLSRREVGSKQYCLSLTLSLELVVALYSLWRGERVSVLSSYHVVLNGKSDDIQTSPFPLWL